MVDIVTAARELIDRGIPVFPLGVDKQPLVEGGFQAATLDYEGAARLFRRAALIGVPTGQASGIDALDIDVKKGGVAWEAANRSRLPFTVMHRTRSGGMHYLFRARPGLRCSISRIAPGVDVRAEGGYIVWWPAAGLERLGAPELADWPPAVLLALGAQTRKADATDADLAPPCAADVVALLDRMPNPESVTREDYAAVMLAAVGCIRGLAATGNLEDDDESEIGDAAVRWAERWEGGAQYDESEKWESDWSQRDKPLAGWRNLIDHARRLGVDVSRERAARAAAEFAAAPPAGEEPAAGGAEAGHAEDGGQDGEDSEYGWLSKLLRDEKGRVRGNLANAVAAFRHAPAWRGVLAHDDFETRIVFRRPPPWIGSPRAIGPMSDYHATLAAEWLAHHEIDAGDQVAFKAMVAVAKENPFHPVRDYLDGLAWDRQPRIDSWFTDYLGAADTALHRAFAAKFLISAVARIYEPGCKVDTAPVLEGRQGLGKSQVCRALFGAEWFMDRMPDITTKDAQQSLLGVWGIELAEMAAVRRADANAVKALLSTPVDRFRPSYGRVTENHPRQCVFIATVNPNGGGYLQDETGARRFWPVLCGATWPEDRRADARAVAAIRNQLWAEAVERYRAGEKWFIEDHELERAQAEAAAERFDTDEWQTAVQEFIAGQPFVQMRDILTRLRLDFKDQTQAAQNRVARILTTLGWTRRIKRIGGVVCRVYYPPATGAKVVSLTDTGAAESGVVITESVANLMG